MDRELLYRNLSELEVQLKGIKSATEQVNAVLAADKALAQSFQQCTQSVIEQINALQAWYQTRLSDIQSEASSAISSATSTLQNFDATCRATLNDTSTTIKAENKEQLEKIQGALSNAITKMQTDFQTLTDKVKNEMSGSLSSLSDLATNTLPTLVTNLKNTINNDLEPLVKVEMAKTLSDALAQYKETFTRCENSLTQLTTDLTTKMSRIVVDVESACGTLATLPANIKEQIDNFKATFEVSLLNQQQLLVSINSNIEQIKTDISKDLKVSEQAAKDTVAAMQKLDKVAEQFNKAIVDMAQKNNELAEKVSKNEQKLTGIEKTNKLLIALLIVSILVSVVTRMI